MGGPDRVIDAVRGSTRALVSVVERLTAEQVGEPSALPGWSRGHVLSHLARNADGLRALMLSARSGQPVAMYASTQARDADIAAGASRSSRVIVEDFMHATQALEIEIDSLASEQWAQPVELHTTTGAQRAPVSTIVDMRLREVEIHHVDLDVGHDFSTTNGDTLRLLLNDAVERLSGQAPNRIELIASDIGATYVVLPQDEAAQHSFRARATAAETLGYLTERSAALPGLPPPPTWG